MPYDMKKGGGTANADTPGSFSSKDTNTISSLSTSAFSGTDPDPKKKKKKKATTTLKNALASDKDYQVVPGFEERLGGELEGVTVTAPAKTKQPRISSTGQEVTTPHPGRYIPYGGGKAGKKAFNKRKDYKAYKQHHETQKEKYFQDPRNWRSTYKK